MTRFIELNHVIYDGLPAWPGLPPARVEAILDHAASRPKYQNQAEFLLGKVELAGNTGTYIDSPFHRFPEGADLAEIPLPAVADLPGIKVLSTPNPDGSLDLPLSPAEAAGKAVLVRTGRDRLFGSPEYYQGAPYLSDSAIDLLVKAQARLVGVDFGNVDSTADPARPAHTRLLKAGVLIVENLTNLEELPPAGFRFFAVPLRIRRGAAFPVRAFALADE